MGDYIEITKKIIKYSFFTVKDNLGVSNVDIKFGFVAYRDHPPEDSTYVTKMINLDEYEKVILFVNSLNALGGGDVPEAVMDGLFESSFNISWRKKSIRYIIHIGDAPPRIINFYYLIFNTYNINNLI